jgi:16S rRNA processing protein RimM
VSVEVATSFPERFRGGVRLLWRRGAEERPLVVAGARPHGGRFLLRFEGIEDVQTARALAGGELLVTGTEAFPAPEGFFYSHRIAGWRCEDPGGRPLGVVEGLEETAAGPLLTVSTP